MFWWVIWWHDGQSKRPLRQDKHGHYFLISHLLFVLQYFYHNFESCCWTIYTNRKIILHDVFVQLQSIFNSTNINHGQSYPIFGFWLKYYTPNSWNWKNLQKNKFCVSATFDQLSPNSKVRITYSMTLFIENVFLLGILSPTKCSSTECTTFRILPTYRPPTCATYFQPKMQFLELIFIKSFFKNLFGL